jgi:hypothetical protein
MDKYIHIKTNNSINKLKLVHFGNDQKTGQFYSEPTSLEVTPKNMMRMKLEPLDKVTLNQKLTEISKTQSITSSTSNNSVSAKISVVIPQKKFLMSVLEDTPKSNTRMCALFILS